MGAQPRAPDTEGTKMQSEDILEAHDEATKRRGAKNDKSHDKAVRKLLGAMRAVAVTSADLTST